MSESGWNYFSGYLDFMGKNRQNDFVGDWFELSEMWLYQWIELIELYWELEYDNWSKFLWELEVEIFFRLPGLDREKKIEKSIF